MPLRRTLILTAARRTDLESARDHDPRPYVRERAAALLKIADGQSPHAVARHGLLKPRDPDTLYSLARPVPKLGSRGADRPSPGRLPREASLTAADDLDAAAPGAGRGGAAGDGPHGHQPAAEPLDPAAVRATFDWLRDYTLSGVWRALHRRGLRLRSGRAQQYSPDPDYAGQGDSTCWPCLGEAAAAPGRVVPSSSTRWATPAGPTRPPDWTGRAPARALADRPAASSGCGG